MENYAKERVKTVFCAMDVPLQFLALNQEIKKLCKNEKPRGTGLLKKKAKKARNLAENWLEMTDCSGSYVLNIFFEEFFDCWKPLISHVKKMPEKPTEKDIFLLRQKWMQCPIILDVSNIARQCYEIQDAVHQEVATAIRQRHGLVSLKANLDIDTPSENEFDDLSDFSSSRKLVFSDTDNLMSIVREKYFNMPGLGFVLKSWFDEKLHILRPGGKEGFLKKN